MITRIFSYKGHDTMVRLYKSLVRPHLELCVSAWSPYYKKDRVVRTGSTSLHQNVSRSTNITICWQITVPRLVVLGRETKSFRCVGSLQNVRRVVQNKLWQYVYAQQCYDYKRTHSWACQTQMSSGLEASLLLWASHQSLESSSSTRHWLCRDVRKTRLCDCRIFGTLPHFSHILAKCAYRIFFRIFWHFRRH